MKQVLFSLMILFASQMMANNDQKVYAPIQKVNLHFLGADITRSSNVSLQVGNNLLVFDNLSKYILKESIQINSDKKIEILDVQYEKYRSKLSRLDSIESKEKYDLIAENNKQIKDLQHDIASYELEIEVLKSNLNVKGNTTITSNQVQSIATHYRVQYLKTKRNIDELQSMVDALKASNKLLRNEISKLNAKKKFTSRIIVEVQSADYVKTNMELVYACEQAGWRPIYDYRVNDLNAEVDMTLWAKFFNHTGIKWDNVNVSFTTAEFNPALNLPKLEVWDIANSNNRKGSFSKKKRFNSELKGVEQQQTVYDIDDVEVPEMSINYTVEGTHNIDQSKIQSLKLKSFKVQSEYSHYASPSKDESVYLVSKLGDWEQYELLEADTRVYLDNKYVGLTKLDFDATTDTIKVSLGVDQKVETVRVTKELKKNRLMGLSKKDVVSYEVTIKNSHKYAIQLTLIDQVPISSDSKVEVDVVTISRGNLDKDKGFVHWNIKLDPNASKSFVIKYVVKYPKDKVIVKRQTKTYACPKF